MATAEQLKALVQSYATGDQSRFCSVAMQIAAHAARSGKEKLAAELRTLVDEAKKRQHRQGVRVVHPGTAPTPKSGQRAQMNSTFNECHSSPEAVYIG